MKIWIWNGEKIGRGEEEKEDRKRGGREGRLGLDEND